MEIEEHIMENHDELKEKSKIKKEKIKGDFEYINWLEQYTNEKKFFTNDDLNDKNVECLEQLYYVINDYGKANYIYPTKITWGNYYTITYNSKFYEIGYMSNEETFFYCKKVAFTNNKKIIDFNDIINRKKNTETELIRMKLTKLSILLNELSFVLPEIEVIKEVHKVYVKRK